MFRQLIERDQRTGDAFAIEPSLRLGAVPGRDSRQDKTRQPLRQLARHGFADLAQPGNGNALGRQIAAPVIVVAKTYFQFAARFSANDASPSDASCVCRRAECILTSRA